MYKQNVGLGAAPLLPSVARRRYATGSLSLIPATRVRFAPFASLAQSHRRTVAPWCDLVRLGATWCDLVRPRPLRGRVSLPSAALVIRIS
jgi:hypothetical protein